MSHKRGREIPSGAIHAGEYIRPGHWKENLASAMLILAVRSSSIYVQIIMSSTLPNVTKTTVSCFHCRSSNASGYRESEGGSNHNVFTVEVETWNHWF